VVLNEEADRTFLHSPLIYKLLILIVQGLRTDFKCTW